MKQMTMRSLLFVLAIGAYTAQTLPMLRQERRAFDVAQKNFEGTCRVALKNEHLITLLTNVKCRAEQALQRGADEATRKAIQEDLQTIKCDTAGYHVNRAVREIMEHFVRTDDRNYAFDEFVAFFQQPPTESHTGAAQEEAAAAGPAAPSARPALIENAQPPPVVENLIALIMAPGAVDQSEAVGAHAGSAEPVNIRAEQRAQPQAQGWWPWLVKRSWWLAPIVVAVIALVYRKKSSVPMQRPNGQRPDGQRSNLASR